MAMYATSPIAHASGNAHRRRGRVVSGGDAFPMSIPESSPPSYACEKSPARDGPAGVVTSGDNGTCRDWRMTFPETVSNFRVGKPTRPRPSGCDGRCLALCFEPHRLSAHIRPPEKLITDLESPWEGSYCNPSRPAKGRPRRSSRGTCLPLVRATRPRWGHLRVARVAVRRPDDARVNRRGSSLTSSRNAPSPPKEGLSPKPSPKANPAPWPPDCARAERKEFWISDRGFRIDSHARYALSGLSIQNPKSEIEN